MTPLKFKIGDRVTFSTSLVRQGKHRFYTLSMPSKVLAMCCTVDTRAGNPLDGFQRRLDSKRADEIAHYIDKDFGTIPSAIVLSAQPVAELQYSRERRSITFLIAANSFLILDGQHRVFGFSRAKTDLRVPVVIYNELNRSQECRLFIDINTKQRPVPNELLLDIKKLADVESDDESKMRAVFDLFYEDARSPLLGFLSKDSRISGRLSRVTFNSGLRGAWDGFADSEPEKIFLVLGAYLRAWMRRLKQAKAEKEIARPVLFKAFVALFPVVAQRVADRFDDYSVDAFSEVLEPVFAKTKSATLRSPGNSHLALLASMHSILQKQFTLG